MWCSRLTMRCLPPPAVSYRLLCGFSSHRLLWQLPARGASLTARLAHDPDVVLPPGHDDVDERRPSRSGGDAVGDTGRRPRGGSRTQASRLIPVLPEEIAGLHDDQLFFRMVVQRETGTGCELVPHGGELAAVEPSPARPRIRGILRKGSPGRRLPSPVHLVQRAAAETQ